MPAGDGTGPTGEGPMTGQGMGFCMLKHDKKDPSRIEGFAGIDGKKIRLSTNEGKEVTEMPGGDGTGPGGMGPMTGRAAGYCAGYPVPGFANPMPGRGFGYGFGRGRGGFGRGLGLGFRGGRGPFAGVRPGWGGYWGAPYGTPPTPYGQPYGYAGPSAEQEADMLKGQAEYFEDALDGIRKRIAELEAEAKKEKK